MNHQKIFAGPVRVRHIVVTVFRFPCAGVRMLRGLSRGRGFQMRIEHGQFGIEIGFDLRERDLALRLHLKMDRLILCFLGLKLGLM